MLKLDLKDKALLDMGCGTAVLAILAAKKEASRVVAIDLDEWAYHNAIENCRLNNAHPIQVALGGAEQIENFGRFDFIFANINRNVLLNDLPSYVSALKKGSLLFMSGFYTEDVPLIEKACNGHNLRVLSVTERDNWAVMKTRYAISPNLS
jgi:ribosomal protein L11 methyltransferase